LSLAEHPNMASFTKDSEECATDAKDSKDTGERVRELLARSASAAPALAAGAADQSRRAVPVRGAQVPVRTPSAWELERGQRDYAIRPMPALSTEELTERARRPIPHPIPRDARDPEIYRMIYGGLKLPRQAPVVIIGITSAIRGEGRTTIARLMAQVLSKEVDTSVTLVEADIEHPTLLRPSSPGGPRGGLMSVLREEHQLHEVIGRWSAEFPNLYVIPGGHVADDGARLLRRLGTHDPFRGPGGLKGLVILDLPPLVDGSCGAIAAEVADATVLVVRAGVTHSATVREAIARLGERPPQGVVLNGFRSPIPGWVPGFR